MAKQLIISIILSLSFNSFSQSNHYIEIADMKWGADFNIHIKFSNDSTSIYDVQALHHSSSKNNLSQSAATYYPVNLDTEFINSLKDRKIESFVEDTVIKQNKNANRQTLWSAIHYNIGGGWIHFINCLVYAFESNSLSLTSPIMQRPESNWKPNPITESYKRTKKWKYYAPVSQKLAIKEYKIKEKQKDLGDIPMLPAQFNELFINTTDKNYKKLVANNKLHEKAIIDMVKLLVGANYLGQEQINYIASSIRSSILKYNTNNLPPVIIFDDFEAAVAMSLNKDGYKIDKVVFNNEAELTEDEIIQRKERMHGIVKSINEINKKVFEKRLKNYYN